MVSGFDVGLEMSGSIHAFNDMIDVMYHGGKMALLGILPEKAAVNWNKSYFQRTNHSRHLWKNDV
ncbi:MAG: hypothetical protein MZV64_42175 [Ignavibacteriales bacterium]|nr:hypothetical protein [Ignavibacteriales bacterium]